VDSGDTWRTPFASYDPDSSSWRTWRACLDGDSDEYSETWPRQGSMRNGYAYELPTSEPPTVDGASSLLPTPAASNPNDGEDLDSWQAPRDRIKAEGINGNGMGTPLAIAVRLLPTPMANLGNGNGSRHPDKRRAGGHTPSLKDVTEHLLPTPAARDWRSGKSKIMDRNSRPLNEVIEMGICGDPTSQPSAAGSDPPGQLLLPWENEDD